MSRLGGKVPSEDEYSEEEEDLATSPLRFKSKASKSSDENSEKKKSIVFFVQSMSVFNEIRL